MINYAKRCNIGSPIGEIWIPENEPCDMWSQWELGVREFLMGKIDGETRFLDIGANIGYFSLWASTVAEKVFSVEPNPILYEMLRDNLSRFSNAQVHNIAMGDYETYGCGKNRAFYYRIDASGDGRAYNPTECGDGNKWLMSYIQNETLCSFQDKYIGNDGINLIKMDCEGFEYEILSGLCLPFFNRYENKDCEVLLELHGPMIESRGLDFNKFLDHLLSNFVIEDVYGNRYINDKDIPARGHVLLKNRLESN